MLAQDLSRCCAALSHSCVTPRSGGREGAPGAGGRGSPNCRGEPYTPRTHVPFLAQAFSRCLKATVKRAGLILAAGPSPGNRPGRRSFFLPSLPPRLRCPLVLPLALALCVIKTSLPATSQPTARPFGGQFLRGQTSQPGRGSQGSRPQRCRALYSGTWALVRTGNIWWMVDGGRGRGNCLEHPYSLACSLPCPSGSLGLQLVPHS